MKKLTLLPIISAAIFLSACGSTGTSPETTSASPTSTEAAPPSFKFEATEVEIGYVAPDEINGGLFDPCRDMTEGDYSSMGLQIVGRGVDSQNLVECVAKGWHGQETDLEFVFAGELATKEEMAQRPPAEPPLTQELYLDHLPAGSVMYHPEEEPETGCTIAVPTSRGWISVTAGTRTVTGDLDSNCDDANDYIHMMMIAPPSTR